MAAKGEPRENGYAERLMRTIKEEEVDVRTGSWRAGAERRGEKRQKCFPRIVKFWIIEVK